MVNPGLLQGTGGGKDIPSTMDTTKETDSIGGSRDVINSRQGGETTVSVTDSWQYKHPM